MSIDSDILRRAQQVLRALAELVDGHAGSGGDQPDAATHPDTDGDRAEQFLMRRRKHAKPRTVAILVSGCVGAAVLAGCAPQRATPGLTDPDAIWQGGQVMSQATPNSSPVGVKNITSWALPLDDFVPRFGNLDNYAEQLLIASCLGEAGIEWPVPWQEVEEPLSPMWNAAGRRVFHREIAEKYGFRTNLVMSKSAQLWETFLMYRPTEAGFQEAFDECLTSIRKEHPIPDQEDTMFVLGLVNQLQEEGFQDPGVLAAADLWRSCIEPLGVGELPKNPNEFPSLELQEELGAAPPVKTVEPSARELEVAIAHATCLDTSGFSQMMYEMEWTLQEKAIERERAKLDGIRDAVRAHQAEVEKIIAANAPKA